VGSASIRLGEHQIPGTALARNALVAPTAHVSNEPLQAALGDGIRTAASTLPRRRRRSWCRRTRRLERATTEQPACHQQMTPQVDRQSAVEHVEIASSASVSRPIVSGERSAALTCTRSDPPKDRSGAGTRKGDARPIRDLCQPISVTHDVDAHPSAPRRSHSVLVNQAARPEKCATWGSRARRRSALPAAW